MTSMSLRRPTTLGGGNFTLQITRTDGDITVESGRYLVTSGWCAKALPPRGFEMVASPDERGPGGVVWVFAERAA